MYNEKECNHAEGILIYIDIDQTRFQSACVYLYICYIINRI